MCVCVCQSSVRPLKRKVRALVDCMSVGSDQLAFCKNDIIIVTAADDPHWWVSIYTQCINTHTHTQAFFLL